MGKGSNRSLASGAGLTLPSIVSIRNFTAMIGATLIAVGIWGMVSIGSEVLESARDGAYDYPGQGAYFQYSQYVFMFTMIAGLVISIYSGVANQAENARARRKIYNR